MKQHDDKRGEYEEAERLARQAFANDQEWIDNEMWKDGDMRTFCLLLIKLARESAPSHVVRTLAEIGKAISDKLLESDTHAQQRELEQARKDGEQAAHEAFGNFGELLRASAPSTTPQKPGESTRDRLVRDLVDTKAPAPTETPRTDALSAKLRDLTAGFKPIDLWDHARQLECELAEANAGKVKLTEMLAEEMAASVASATRRSGEPVWVWGLTQEGIRDEVAQFAALMERKLKANDHKDHWSGVPMGYLLRRLREEIEELELAVKAGKDAELIGGEAADVGNFAMMIADNMSSLPQLPALPKNRADGTANGEG